MPWICWARIFLGNLSITSKVETCHHIHICIPNVSHKPFCYHHFYENIFYIICDDIKNAYLIILHTEQRRNYSETYELFKSWKNCVMQNSCKGGTILMTKLTLKSPMDAGTRRIWKPTQKMIDGNKIITEFSIKVMITKELLSATFGSSRVCLSFMPFWVKIPGSWIIPNYYHCGLPPQQNCRKIQKKDATYAQDSIEFWDIQLSWYSRLLEESTLEWS